MPTKELAAEIRRFSSEHPQGWGHDEWLDLLHTLSEEGHDISDGDAIGLTLESERLSQVLRRMELNGLGPKRVDALAEHFGTLWNLMSATPEELAQLPNVSRLLAEQILEVLQEAGGSSPLPGADPGSIGTSLGTHNQGLCSGGLGP